MGYKFFYYQNIRKSEQMISSTLNSKNAILSISSFIWSILLKNEFFTKGTIISTSKIWTRKIYTPDVLRLCLTFFH